MNEIRKLPSVEERVETGPIQFGNDWPGYFIRGDNAFAIRLAIANVLFNPQDPMARIQLRAFMQELDGCNMTKELVKEMQDGPRKISSTSNG